MDLSQVLDAAEFDGLAIDKQPTGFTASILIDGTWSPYEFATSPSDAVVKCVRLHGRTKAPDAAVALPNPSVFEDAPILETCAAPAPLCPPPY